MTTDDSRRQLRAAAEGTGLRAALLCLGSAIAWTRKALVEDSRTTPGSSAAVPSAADHDVLETVIALDDAFASVPELARGVSTVLLIAGAGVEVEQRLRRTLDDLQSVREEAARARLRLAAIADAERELSEQDRERGDLERRIVRLHDLRRRAEAIPRLREEERRLSLREEAMRSELAQAESVLTIAAGRVLDLTTDRLADLEERTRTVLSDLAQAEAAHDAERQRYEAAINGLADAVQRYEAFADIHDDLAAVAAYEQADAELVAALAAVANHPAKADIAGAEEAIAIIRGQLQTVEDALSRALAVHQRSHDAARRVLEHGDPAASAVP